VLVSKDGKTWTTVAQVGNGVRGERRQLTFESVRAKYIRILGKTRTSKYGYSIYEIEVR